MKINLTDAIVNHIFDNFGLTTKQNLSLKDERFELDNECFLEFVDENEVITKTPLWGLSITIDSSKFRIIVADFSNSDLEYAIIVKLDGCPSYACYLAIDTVTGDPYNGLICFSLQPNAWLRANIGLQGTFLSGMESLRNITGKLDLLEEKESKALVEELKSFIVYHENILDSKEVE